jgi:hypothetical protein
MENLKALFIVVNAGFAQEIIDIARDKGASGATIMNARGEGTTHQTVFGITIDSEKEMVLSIVPGKVAVKIMDTIKEKAGVKTPAHGVCFLLPVDKMTATIATTGEE